MTVQVAGRRFEGFLVVDSIVDDTSSGGVRICADLRVDEIRTLAREMTLKYSLFGLPRGGAKAGVRLDTALPRPDRLQALQEFGSKLGPIVRSGLYYPGMDMNCGPEELRAIYRGAGIVLGGVTDTSSFTALGVFQALEACAAFLGGQAPVTLAIEGFGSVARHLALRLPPRYRIVGVATVAGAVLNEAGFAAVRLAAAREQYGDAFVSSLEGDTVSPGELLAAGVDILVPAARTGSLTTATARSVRARAVLPIANAPYADGAVAVLHERGIVCLPGYVVNMGGVFASSLYDQGVSVAAIESLFAGPYRSFVGALLETARLRRVPATELAASLAARRLPTNQQRRSLARRIYGRFMRRRMPRRFRGSLALRRSLRALVELEQETVADRSES